MNGETCQCPEAFKEEYELIFSKLDEDEQPVFKKFCSYYSTEDEFKTLFVRYRHYLKDRYDINHGVTIYEPLKRPIRIGYLLNKDVVFFYELDEVICNYLRNEGAEVIQFRYEDVQLKASKDGLQVFIKNELAEFDGFLSYGYRNQVNMESYLILVKLLEQKGVVCLHSHYHEIILNNKMLQATHFAAANVPVPDTYQVFDISSCKDLADTNFSNGPAIIKYLNDYGGDSVFKIEDKWNIVNAVAKNLWKGEKVLIQKMVPDSVGQSIRVLCIEGKAFAAMKYVNSSSDDFRSNSAWGARVRFVPLMDDPKFKLYKEVAENAISSIGNVLIGGVDLLDSKTVGVVVLEINSWPDLYDIWFQTQLCSFKRFAEAYVNKIKKTINNKL